MKSYLNLIIAFLFCLSMTSCDWVKQNYTTQTPERIHFSDLYYVKHGNERLIYKGNVLFNGDAWSSDSKSVSIHVESGQLQTANIYHPNGKVAIFIDSRPGQYDDVFMLDNLKESYYFYNDKEQPLLKVYRNPVDRSLLYWRNIDKTSTSYNKSGNWKESDIKYPYENWLNLLERGGAIIDHELKSQN